jgi:hypothetical protein
MDGKAAQNGAEPPPSLFRRCPLVTGTAWEAQHRTSYDPRERVEI